MTVKQVPFFYTIMNNVRVKQSKQLSLDVLDSNGVSHGRLDGSLWQDDNTQYIQVRSLSYQFVS